MYVINIPAPRCSHSASSPPDERVCECVRESVCVCERECECVRECEAHGQEPASPPTTTCHFRSVRLFELPTQADTGSCFAETPCFLSDHIKLPSKC